MNEELKEPQWAIPNPDNIPRELKNLHWGVWKASIRTDKDGVIRVDKQGRPKWNKALLNPVTGYPATTTKPETFGTFEDAMKAYATGHYSGIGVLLSGGDVVGFDLDNTNQLFQDKPKIKKWFESAYTNGIYCERSPSKTGVRLFGLGQLPCGGRNHAGIEIYNKERFLTVTGDIGNNRKTEANCVSLVDAQTYVDDFLKFFPEQVIVKGSAKFNGKVLGSKIVSDIPDLVKLKLPRIFSPDTKSTDKYKLLFSGDASPHDGDMSKATLSLVRHLLMQGLSPEEADLVIRASGLYRDKWDSKRGDSTWGNKEIETAIGYVEKAKAELFPEAHQLKPTLDETQPKDNSPITNIETLDIDETIQYFNSEYFIAPEGANTYVFRESWDDELDHSRLERQTFEGFKKLHPEKVLSAGKQRQAAALWLDSPKRRNYKNGIVFLPNGRVRDGVYNLWKEFGVKPVAGDASAILNYLKETICDNNEKNYEYLIKWLAYCVQHPERQGGVAVVCRGEKGTGKAP